MSYRMIHAARRLMCDKFSTLCTLEELNVKQAKEDEGMANETIVTLPKKVAEAMDEIKRKNGEGALRDLPQIYTLIEEGSTIYKTVIDYARSDDNLYFEAVVNGYRAEMTPEEKVAEYYESLFGANQFDKKEFVLVKTLNLLGVSIYGVNER